MPASALRAAYLPSARLAAASLLLAAFAVGCNNTPSGQESLDRQFKENSQYVKKSVAQFAGHVTVDGQPPSKDYTLFVILTDPTHLDENAHLKKPKLSAMCDEQGNFAFGTYGKDDGVATGKYIVTFVELRAPLSKANASGGRSLSPVGAIHAQKVYDGPDELKNLYNDPDKNKSEPNFNVDVQPPGKSDYQFDLAVGSKEAATPGPNAVTVIGRAH